MNLTKILSISFVLFVGLVSAQSELFNAINISEDLKKSANAVVRLNDFDVSINSQNEIVFTHTRIVTVLNEKGNGDVGAIVGYDRLNKVRKIEAQVYNEFGKEMKKFRKKDFIDHSAVDGSDLYNDSRVLIMGYTPVTYPYTVRFYYELESPNTAMIPTWRPVLDYYVSVEKDSYTVTDHAKLGLRTKLFNTDEVEINKNISETKIELGVENFKAIKPEELSPSLEKIAPRAMFAVDNFHCYGVNGSASNWQEFGEWIIVKLLAGRDEVSEVTKREVLALVSGISDPYEKAAKIYEYVQKNTRYISVQVGIGGIQPIPAMEVDKVKYGDCKGLTNYTQALFKAAGIPSYYCVVEAGREKVSFDEEFATLGQGNHIILAIPKEDGYMWIDCTSQSHPFGFVGDFTDDRNVLLVKPGGSDIVKTPVYQDDTNFQEKNGTINLLADGTIESELTIRSEGLQYDSRFMLENESDKDIKKYYKEYWGLINNLEVDNYEFNNDKDEVEFTENLKLHARSYASINDDKMIFSPNVFSRNNYVPDRYRDRKLPFEISRGYLDHDEFRIKIPEGYKFESVPLPSKVVTDYGEYEISMSTEDNELVYNRRIFIKQGQYGKDDYDLYRKFRRKVAKLDKSIVVLTKE